MELKMLDVISSFMFSSNATGSLNEYNGVRWQYPSIQERNILHNSSTERETGFSVSTFAWEYAA